MPAEGRRPSIAAANWRSALAMALAALAAITGSSALAGTRPEKASDPRTIIDAAAARYLLDNPQAAALAVGVVYDGKTYRSQYGSLEPGKRIAAKPSTLYPIASITKTFTGTLLAQAVIEKRVSPSDDVRKYLDGDFPNLEFAGRAILVSDLLDHRSGLPFLLPDGPELQPEFAGDPRPYTLRVNEALKHYTRDRFMADLRAVKLTAMPGSSYQYSNAGAQLAGYVLERLYGRSYESLLRTKILAPLGMADTTVRLDRSDRRHLAPGWDDKGGLAILPEGAEPAGGIKSTIGDMVKYVRWQVAETDPEVKLSHQRVWTAKDPIFEKQGSFGIGLNWQVAELAGRRAIFQDGMIEGYSALVVIQPETKLGIVIMTNQLDQKSAAALRELMGELLHSIDTRSVPLPG